jgi:hypothetical protein
VASGVYQLPLFRGVPSMALLNEMQRLRDVNGTLSRAIKVGAPNPCWTLILLVPLFGCAFVHTPDVVLLSSPLCRGSNVCWLR